MHDVDETGVAQVAVTADVALSCERNNVTYRECLVNNSNIIHTLHQGVTPRLICLLSRNGKGHHVQFRDQGLQGQTSYLLLCLTPQLHPTVSNLNLPSEFKPDHCLFTSLFSP